VLAAFHSLTGSWVKTAYADEAAPSVTGPATILSNGTITYLGYLNRGDKVQIVKEEKNGETAASSTVKLLVDGQIGEVPANLVRADSAPAYEAWDGYALEGAVVFGSYKLVGETITCSLNDAVHVEDNLGSCYYVTVGDVSGYMSFGEVSETELEEPVAATYSYSYLYYYSGGSGMSDHSDSGVSGSASEVIEQATGGWTEEKL